MLIETVIAFTFIERLHAGDADMGGEEGFPFLFVAVVEELNVEAIFLLAVFDHGHVVQGEEEAIWDIAPLPRTRVAKGFMKLIRGEEDVAVINVEQDQTPCVKTTFQGAIDLTEAKGFNRGHLRALPSRSPSPDVCIRGRRSPAVMDRSRRYSRRSCNASRISSVRWGRSS